MRNKPKSVISIEASERDLISIHHDGTISWEDMQQIKNEIWGEDVVAVEMFPPEDQVVNSGNYRHLWRWLSITNPPDLYKTEYNPLKS